MNTDQVIMAGISSGDQCVLKDFYKENIRYIQGYILRNSGNTEDVEDVFQDALVVLYEKLIAGTLEISVPLKTYFYGICKNIWRNRLRRKKKFRVIDNSALYLEQETEDVIDNDIENRDQEHLYKKYFLKLSTGNKNILHLSFEGKSAKEIAQLTGYTVGYTRKKKFEAKKRLIEMIEKDPVYEELRMSS